VEVVETFGKYSRVVKPGCNIVWCCFGQSAVGKLSTALQHQEVQCECKTKDGVFVELVVSPNLRAATSVAIVCAQLSCGVVAGGSPPAYGAVVKALVCLAFCLLI
jgi:hypothetical protein